MPIMLSALKHTSQLGKITIHLGQSLLADHCLGFSYGILQIIHGILQGFIALYCFEGIFALNSHCSKGSRKIQRPKGQYRSRALIKQQAKPLNLTSGDTDSGSVSGFIRYFVRVPLQISHEGQLIQRRTVQIALDRFTTQAVQTAHMLLIFHTFSQNLDL